MRLSLRPGSLLAAALLAAAAPAHAGDTDAGRVYRCPDNTYTNLLSTVRAKGCTPLDNANISVVGPAPAGAAAPRKGAAGVRPASGAARVSPSQQSQRDAEARALLQQELQAQQVRLQQLQTEYQGGQPDRLGNEKNYQTYLDRVQSLKSQIDMVQANIEALQRELARHAD